MKKLVPLIALSSVILTLITGCASYNASSLEPLHFSSAEIQTPYTAVSIAAKSLSAKECKKYLGRNVIKAGYHPIQLTIHNNSDTPRIFSMNRLSLPCVSPLEVAKKVHTSTVGRAVGYGAAAIFVCPLLIVPAVYDGLKSSEANDHLDDDYWEKGAKDHRIEPMSHSNMLLFVDRKHYESHFNLTLIDPINNQFEKFSVNIA